MRQRTKNHQNQGSIEKKIRFFSKFLRHISIWVHFVQKTQSKNSHAWAPLRRQCMRWFLDHSIVSRITKRIFLKLFYFVQKLAKTGKGFNCRLRLDRLVKPISRYYPYENAWKRFTHIIVPARSHAEYRTVQTAPSLPHSPEENCRMRGHFA
jgi:hypothetical protein